jgi:hypothetical protein
MRVRMIRPAYWTDADLHTRLTADVREFYVGLWMLADDAGYVTWDVDRVGAELYPFRPFAWRRKHLPEWLALLGEDHAQLLSCGRHVVVPNLAKFQSPPRPSYTVQRAHDGCLRQVVAPASSVVQVVAGGSSTVREGKGVGFIGGPAGESSEFQRKMAAAGAPRTVPS